MRTRALWFIIPVVLFALNVSYYLPFISDDALISLRYAQRFSRGLGLTWNDGERVEGYSNLLWVVLSSALIKTGLSGVLSLRIMGTVCSVAFLAVVFFYYRREPLPVLFPLLFTSISAPLAIWAVGGLEQPMILLLLGVAIPALWRAMEADRVSAWITASVPLALIALTRNDGILFTVFALLCILFCGGGRRVWWIVLLPALFVAGQTIFRLVYYGDFLPNTARVKLQPSPETALLGLKYLIKGGVVLFPFAAAALAGLPGALRTRDAKILLPFAMAAGWCCYLVIIGGDIFPGLRHFLPLLALFTWISIETIKRSSPELKARVVAAGLLLLPLFIAMQFEAGSSRTAVDERWEWDGMVTSILLRDAFRGESPLVAVTAAGTIPYWTGFTCVDMLGLNDRFLAMNHGTIEGECVAWHNICNPDYVLSRDPDIVSFNAAGDTSGLPIARALLGSRDFTDNYSRVFIFGDRPYPRTGILWFNRHSPLTGIRTEGDSLVIPALFFNLHKHTLCRLSDGVLGINVSQGRPAAMILREPENMGSCSSASAARCKCTVEILYNGDLLIELYAAHETFVSEVVLTPSV